MNKRVISGLVGVVVGGAWLANNYKYFEEQGFGAIGMPVLITVVGLIYLIGGLKS
ncbi:MAG: hypothetical protein GY757_38665 [bacterium]|nr:hypothetical protein [bacterium]